MAVHRNKRRRQPSTSHANRDTGCILGKLAKRVQTSRNVLWRNGRAVWRARVNISVHQASEFFEKHASTAYSRSCLCKGVLKIRGSIDCKGMQRRHPEANVPARGFQAGREGFAEELQKELDQILQQISRELPELVFRLALTPEAEAGPDENEGRPWRGGTLFFGKICETCSCDSQRQFSQWPLR